MNVAVEEKGLVRILTIEDSGEDIKNYVENAIKEISKNVSIKGFRKGHAPKSIIKARYKEAIKGEVVRKFVEEKLENILEEKNLKPVSPDLGFGDINLEGDNKITFKITFEVAPEFELKDYEGLEIPMIKYEVTDEDVEKTIQRLLDQNATYETEDKEVEEGDLIKIKYSITDEEGNNETDELEVIVGANQLRKEIEDEVKGKKAGDKIHLENIPLYNEKGEEIGEATVDIEILEVKKKNLPEFNDEFVKKLGLGENVEEAKRKIKEDLEKQVKEAKEAELYQKIIDELAKQYDFEVPTSLLKAELEFLINNYLKQLQNLGIKPNQDMINAVAQGLEATAIKNVRIMFVLNKIAEKEGIKVKEEEIDKEIEKLSENSNAPFTQVKNYLEENGQIANIRYEILKRKVLDLIKEKANVVEMTKEEYEEKYGKLEEQTEENQEETKKENNKSEEK
ncbi:MAG TPA: trigger factor [Hydrogenothermaceae bacterium]|nr:trigger factor [Hydrogenothermaceae bacterium]